MSSPVTAPAASTGVMPAWGKTALQVGLIFIGCWGGAILYWRMTERMPGTGELAFCLVAAPLLISGGFWLSRRMLDQGAIPTPALAPVAATSSADRGLVILDAALRLPCGSSADEVYTAIKSNKARPDLDRELLDDDGFPVMTARCAIANDDSLRDETAEWMVANGFADAAFIDEHWRALMLATQVVGDLSIDRESATQMLHLVSVAPEDWTVQQRRAAGAWLTNTISQSGWPADRITPAPEPPDAIRLAETLNHLATPSDTPALTMLVAFASNLGDQTVARWSGDRTLFTSANGNGMMPGEGAAGLLLADLRQIRPEAADGCAVLTAIDVENRDISDDSIRRGDAKLLTALATRACDRACVAPTQLAAIACDTGHRPNRVLELMGLASGISSHLDAPDDVIRIGAVAATCGDVPALAAIVLARHCAIVRQGPALWASNEHPNWRAAAIIHPPTHDA